MLPVAKFPTYRISFDDTTGLAYLMFETLYEGIKESPAIVLNDGLFQNYIEYGDAEFLRKVKRIEEDYQVGRFSKENPRILFDYELATSDVVSEINLCFLEQMTLIEQEACRLLFLNISPFSNVATRYIIEMMTQGKRLSIELFCLAFRFYDSDRPLIDSRGNVLIECAHHTEAVKVLSKSPVAGCRDSTYIALELLISNGSNNGNILRLLSLAEISYQGTPDFKSRLRYYSIKIIELTGQKYHFSEMTELIKQFKQEFPSCVSMGQVESDVYLKSWLFVESALTWERDCLNCLEQCLLEAGLELEFKDIQNLLHLPSGKDSNWHSYSVGQGIKYLPHDPRDFTKETVAKPKIPISSREKFVASVWLHYLVFFRKAYQVDYAFIEAVANKFFHRWNSD